MSPRAAIAGTMRALLLAAATAGAAFGLLVVFHPFAASTIGPAIIGTPQADALHAQIDAARDALRQTEAALAAQDRPASAFPADPAGLDAQLAAITARRDLAQRDAAAIRTALGTHADLAALAGLRDSVVVGQLLAQLSALDATIADDKARFRPNHPVMRGLVAQRAALLAQVDSEAAGIAAALESEAKLDDAQLRQLQAQRPAAPAVANAGNLDLAALQAQAASQRAAVDTLLDAYFGLPPDRATSSADPILGALSPLNLFVVAIAAAAALAAQLGLVLRRRRLRRNTDLARWRQDRDRRTVASRMPRKPTIIPALRRAS